MRSESCPVPTCHPRVEACSRKGVTAYLALGANIGDPIARFRWTRTRLAAEHGIVVSAWSPIYRTAPSGRLCQPWFYNACLAVVTTLDPYALLGFTRALEQQAGRRPDVPPDAPRTLDIDILLYDGVQMSDTRLTLPHPRLTRRPFVLVPLADIAPRLKLPPHDLPVKLQLLQLSYDRRDVVAVVPPTHW